VNITINATPPRITDAGRITYSKIAVSSEVTGTWAWRRGTIWLHIANITLANSIYAFSIPGTVIWTELDAAVIPSIRSFTGTNTVDSTLSLTTAIVGAYPHITVVAPISRPALTCIMVKAVTIGAPISTILYFTFFSFEAIVALALHTFTNSMTTTVVLALAQTTI
jgi:hypothetical protein